MSSILIVEDDADIAQLIEHYLRRAGHEVERLSSGSAVMPRLTRRQADLVILDLMLPGMDGLHVCQAMRSDPVTAGIPIIMLTARADEADRVSGLELGADDYVTKPFSPKELAARVAAPSAPRLAVPRRQPGSCATARSSSTPTVITSRWTDGR